MAFGPDKKQVDAAVADPLPGGELRSGGKTANTAAAVDRLIRRLSANGRRLMVCYEAGPCGYSTYRRVNDEPGVSCRVLAPALIPHRQDDRAKTNRRDALSLVKLLRASELTAVWVPDSAKPMK